MTLRRAQTPLNIVFFYTHDLQSAKKTASPVPDLNDVSTPADATDVTLRHVNCLKVHRSLIVVLSHFTSRGWLISQLAGPCPPFNWSNNRLPTVPIERHLAPTLVIDHVVMTSWTSYIDERSQQEIIKRPATRIACRRK